MNDLGNLVKNAREKKGLSQRELSRQTGIDNNTISKIEKGSRKKPNLLSLTKLSKILELDLGLLLQYSGYSKEDEELIIKLHRENPDAIIASTKLDEEIKHTEEQIAKVNSNIQSIKNSLKYHKDSAYRNMSKEDVKFFDEQYKSLLILNEEILKIYQGKLKIFNGDK
jgi:transcriptional regulator with XRE-family HTH domain